NSREFARPPHRAHTYADLKRSLGSWTPDLAIGLRDDWQTLRHAFFMGVRQINRGMVHLRQWIERKRTNRPSRHEMERLWAILEPLGIAPEQVERPEYFITEDE